MDSVSADALPAGSPPSAPGPYAEDLTWTCRVVRMTVRRHILHVSGSLHRAWAGRLAAGLAARNISVVRATARRGSTRWTAQIEIEVIDQSVEPSAIDFLALMRDREEAADPGTVALGAFRVTRTRRDVEVEIRGEDAVGLLSRILRVFAGLGLFPRAMRVETLGSAVRDVFLLQDEAGEPPPQELVAALTRRLEALVPAE